MLLPVPFILFEILQNKKAFVFFFFKDLTYLFDRKREKDRKRQHEREYKQWGVEREK